MSEMVKTDIKITRFDIVQAKKLWEQFEDVPMNPETECIESDWKGFPTGTNREEIWHWFEEQFNISVAKDLMEVENTI